MYNTNRICLALDLKDDEQLIREYDAHHEKVWPEVIESIRQSGIGHMEIYRFHTRLFMIIEANSDFSLKAKATMDAENDFVQRWEELMLDYQQKIPFAKDDEKWVQMKCIFKL